MESLFGAIDPVTVLGLAVAALLLGCAAVLYRMRDQAPFPHHVVRRLRCPHKGRKCTVEFTAEEDAVFYCSAFDFGALACDQACCRSGSLKTLAGPAQGHSPISA
jgi:hypothetical protein